MPASPRGVRAIITKGLHAAGLLDSLRDWIYRWQHPETVETELCFERWFAAGGDPKTMTVADALGRFGTLDKLPPIAKPIVRAILGRRLDLAPYNTLVAAIALGEACAGAKSAIDGRWLAGGTDAASHRPPNPKMGEF